MVFIIQSTACVHSSAAVKAAQYTLSNTVLTVYVNTYTLSNTVLTVYVNTYTLSNNRIHTL